MCKKLIHVTHLEKNLNKSPQYVLAVVVFVISSSVKEKNLPISVNCDILEILIWLLESKGLIHDMLILSPEVYVEL